jgi:hypothetical protein
VAGDVVVTVPILIQQTDGQFYASLAGSSEISCVGATRVEAVAALQTELAQRVAAQELMDLEIQPLGVTGLAGRFHDDPTLREIRDEIYRERERPKAP